MTRAFGDWDQTIFEQPHDLAVPGIMVAVFLLDRKLGGDFFKIAWVSFLDVAAKRRILPGTPKEVSWPSWDLSTLKYPELSTLHDICIMLAAWNFAAKQDDNPPEMFLGPLFTLSGVIVEGVERGYMLEDESTKKIYEEQRKKLASSHGSEEEFVQALKTQLESIASSLEDHRKGTQS